MVVQHNLLAMNSNRMLGLTTRSKAKSTEKLSSGYRVNRAADDAAGLAISEKLRYQIRGLDRGAENIQDGISLCQVADGALAEVDDMLHRMNELSVQAANGTLTDVDRGYIQEEVDHLTSEINRIGATTTFNEIHIFDKETIEKKIGSITGLVSSPSAKGGKMNESYLGNDGNYYPAASIDFSKINSENVKQLNGGYFSFVCPYGCNEEFKITFDTGDNPSSAKGLIGNKHEYTINIKGAISGADVVNAVYDYVSANLPDTAKGSDINNLSAVSGGVGVSHASALVKNGNSLIVISNTPMSTASRAANYTKSLGGRKGEVDSSNLTNIMTPDPVFEIPIQCSSNVDDKEYVRTRLMNAEVLSVEPLTVSTQEAAGRAIENVKRGMKYIADMRSDIGAQQNRLEHSYNNNNNVSENTSAAESRIRDTDMAQEMVRFSNNNILAQAGQSMLAQANQSNEMVLSLLS